MTNPLRFKGEYFFTKEKLTEKLKEDLEDNGGENLPEADNVELYELYCQNLFERFGLSYDENKDRNEVLADISVLFEIGKVLRLNVSEYIGIERIEIPLLSGEIKRTSISTFSFISPALKKDFVNICDIESLKCPFSFEYKTLKTANQIVNPTLSFIENNKEVTVYKSSKEINLSNRQEEVINFNIPIKDIIINSSGVFLLSCSGSELCKVVIPKIKLPLGRDGIQTYEDFIEFINSLSGKPSDDLINFYELTKNRILELWLNDKGIVVKELLDNWKTEGYDMALNDLNHVLRLLGFNKELKFQMRDFFLIEDTEVNSDGYYSKTRIDCSFIWNSYTKVDIIFKINPLFILNINFNLEIIIGGIPLKERLMFNLREIVATGSPIICSFNSSAFCKRSMGKYQIQISNGKNDIVWETQYSIIITGERIKLKDDIVMIGIFNDRLHGPFYIAETPLSQRQLIRLIGGNNEEELMSALKKSRSEIGDNEKLPVTFLSYSCCQRIISILNEANQSFIFSIPVWYDLETALFDNIDENDKKKEMVKVKNELQCVGSNPTKLGVCDLFGNVFLQTSGDFGVWGNKKILFGRTHYDVKNKYIKYTEEYRESEFFKYESITGFCPIMIKKDDDDDDCRTIDSGSSSIDSSWMEDYVKPIDFATFP